MEDCDPKKDPLMQNHEPNAFPNAGHVFNIKVQNKNSNISHNVQIYKGCLHFSSSLDEECIITALNVIAKENIKIKQLILRGHYLTSEINKALAQLIKQNLITEVLDLADKDEVFILEFKLKPIDAIQALKTIYDHKYKEFFPKDLRLNNSFLVNNEEASYLLEIIKAGRIDKLDLRGAILTDKVFKEIYVEMSKAATLFGPSYKTIRLEKAMIDGLCFEEWINANKDFDEKINSDPNKPELIIQERKIVMSWDTGDIEVIKEHQIYETKKTKSDKMKVAWDSNLESQIDKAEKQVSQLESEFIPRNFEGEHQEIRDFLES
jgi:hypothetical protein